MRILTYQVDGEKAGCRVERLLTGVLGLSGGYVSRLKSCPDGIVLNGEKAYVNRRVAAGDVLTVRLYEARNLTRADPVPMPLAVLYEDEDLLILNKPSGITVHADNRRPEEATLENGLAAYLPEDIIAHPVSRLDRGTTGVMTWAKSGYVHELLRRQMHTADFYREYRGIIAGELRPPKGELTWPIGMAEGSRLKRAVRLDGASAFTLYETLSVRGICSLLRLVPKTGRTHQLRVHLSYAGHPLIGDWLYGKEAPELICRPALHAYFLRLKHPVTGRMLELTAPIPADMEKLLYSTEESFEAPVSLRTI